MLKGNFNEAGGRQVHQDDLRVLQDELYKAIELQYVGQGAFIVQGCLVSGSPGNYTIGNGLVFINSKIMEFSQVTSIPSFPRYIVQAVDMDQDPFTLEAGGTAYKRTLIKSELSNNVPVSLEFIAMSASGGRNYNDVLTSQFVRVSGNQSISGQKNFSSDVISNGLNVNSELNNINSTLPNKASKATTITGNDGLYGGGDISTNRTIGLSANGVTTSKIADGSVTADKLSAGVSGAIVGKADVSQSAWVNLPLHPDWSAITQTPQIRRDRFGRINLRGATTNNFLGSGFGNVIVSAGGLSAYNTSGRTMRIPVYSNSDLNGIGYILLSPDGSLTKSGSGGFGIVSLESVSWWDD